MNINFAPVDEGYIKSMVESGSYSNATELVRDAVRQFRKQNPLPSSRLQLALQAGINDIEAGRVQPLTKKLMRNIEKEARTRIASGQPLDLDPDVIGPRDGEPWV
jgi:putative addiction module CopG family antidote